MNLLDKFIQRFPLNLREAEQLAQVLVYARAEFEDLDPRRHEALANKVLEAAQFSFDTLIEGLDYLIHGNKLEESTFECIAKFADYYAYSFKENPDGLFQWHCQLNELLLSYYEDGAEKTAVANLARYHQQDVLETKERLICIYGANDHGEAIAPLCELRCASRWEDFKKMCLVKVRQLYQWLFKKNSAAASITSTVKNGSTCSTESESAAENDSSLSQVKTLSAN
jgi:hypothetical protein